MRNVWPTHQGQNGLPTDDSLIECRNSLLLVIDYIHNSINYNQQVCGADYEPEEVRDMIDPYEHAVGALNALLYDEEQDTFDPERDS